MPTIHFMLADGSRHAIEAENGDILMRIAVRNEFSGILAECGGACSCATCHVHIDKSWYAKLPPRDELETKISAELRPELCRYLTPELDGLIVYVPESQY